MRGHAQSQSQSQSQSPTRIGEATAVSAGDMIQLENGDVLRLRNVTAPQGTDDGDATGADEAAARSRAALGELVLGRVLGAVDPVRDRFGRLRGPALVLDPVDGAPLIWIEGRMVENGHVRVTPEPNATVRVKDLLAAERTARRAGLSLWALKPYHVLGVIQAEQGVGRYALIEGFVLDAAERNGRVFLNFGPDWRTDFTVTVAPDDRPAFAEAGLDLLAMGRRSIRIRGALSRYNGPNLELRTPYALEILSAGGTTP